MNSGKKPKIIVLSGYGLNCEEETAHAFTLAAHQLRSGSASGQVDIVHINDLVSKGKQLKNYQILAIPGGFSFGDDTGSGMAFANKLKNHLELELREFVEGDKLVIGICNGFQILTNLGLLPGALTFNDNPRYTVRWVDLQICSLPIHRPPFSPWLINIDQISLPIAHGEGRFVADKKTLLSLQKNKQIAFKYAKGEISKSQSLPANPNGSLQNIAGVTAFGGRVLGMMPHPERAIFFEQFPHWTYLKEKYSRVGKPVPQFGPGLHFFKNAINYFQ